jgi:hypothetical protein
VHTTSSCATCLSACPNLIDEQNCRNQYLQGLAEAARQAIEQHDDEDQQTESLLGVVDRLRGSSLALFAKFIVQNDDPDVNMDEQEPVYLGERLDGKRHGLGMLQYAAGAEYVGQFADDLPCGFGSERHADGSSFTGCFHEGLRHGMGVYTLGSKVAYLGCFHRGKRSGPGVVCIVEGSPFSRTFWPVVLCVCRADSPDAISAVKFRTDIPHHALLVTDVRLAEQAGLDIIKQARTMMLTGDTSSRFCSNSARCFLNFVGSYVSSDSVGMMSRILFAARNCAKRSSAIHGSQFHPNSTLDQRLEEK